MTFSPGRKKRDPNWVPKPISARQLQWAAKQYIQRYIQILYIHMVYQTL